MKVFFNLLRCAIYVVVIYFLIIQLLKLFTIASAYCIKEVINCYDYLNHVVFWILFLTFGIGILVFIWRLLKTLAFWIVWLSSIICPYKRFAAWSTSIIMLFNAGLFIIGALFTTGWPQDITAKLGLILMAYLIISLSFVVINTAYTIYYIKNLQSNDYGN